MRPGAGGPPAQIRIAIFILDVREIDGAKQSFTADVFVRLQWKDPRLASADGKRTLPLSAAWNPGAQIVNRVSVQTSLPDVLQVDQAGNVIYRQRYTGQFSCWMDLSEFPFDHQIFPILFATPGISPEDIHFVQDKDGGLAKRLSVTDWNVTSWTAKQEPYEFAPGGRSISGYRFEFEASRRSRFFFVQIVFPLTLIICMSWLVFWIDPAQPAPRFSFSVTSMLTVVAFRLMLSNFLPRLSYLTRMDIFVFSCTFLVFVSLLDVVLIGRLLTGNKALATRVDALSRWTFPGLYVLVFCISFLL